MSTSDAVDPVEEAIGRVRGYWEEGRRSLESRKKAGPGRPVGSRKGAASPVPKPRGQSDARLRKARQFADEGVGYTEAELGCLFGLMRENRSVLGVAHVSLLISVPRGDGREEVQRKCLEKAWTRTQLALEVKKLLGVRRQGGRRPKLRGAKEDSTLARVQLRELAVSFSRWCAAMGVTQAGEGATLGALEGLGDEVKIAFRQAHAAMECLRRLLGDSLKPAGKRGRSGEGVAGRSGGAG